MKKIVLFDVDDVLIKGQTQKLLVKFLYSKNKISLSFLAQIYLWFLLYKFHFIKDVITIRKKSYKIFEGWEEKEAKILFNEFFNALIMPNIIKKSEGIIKDHISKGYEVILVSASIKEIVDSLKTYFGLNFIISAELEIENSTYTGRFKNEIPYGENKLRAVKELIIKNNFNLEDSYAYSDHISDLPILNYVKNAIAVNPDNRLRKIASEKNWPIYDF